MYGYNNMSLTFKSMILCFRKKLTINWLDEANILFESLREHWEICKSIDFCFGDKVKIWTKFGRPELSTKYFHVRVRVKEE